MQCITKLCFLESESEVAQSCRTLCDPVEGSLPGSAIHGIFQARILEWAARSHLLSKKDLCPGLSSTCEFS